MYRADTESFLEAFSGVKKNNFIKIIYSYHSGKKFFKASNEKIGPVLSRELMIENARSVFERVKNRYFYDDLLTQLDKGVRSLLSIIASEKSIFKRLFMVKTFEEKRLLVLLGEIEEFKKMKKKEEAEKKNQRYALRRGSKRSAYAKALKRVKRKKAKKRFYIKKTVKIGGSPKTNFRPIAQRLERDQEKIVSLNLRA